MIMICIVRSAGIKKIESAGGNEKKESVVKKQSPIESNKTRLTDNSNNNKRVNSTVSSANISRNKGKWLGKVIVAGIICLGHVLIIIVSRKGGSSIDISRLGPGNSIEFGAWEQDGYIQNGSEKIKWTVLTRQLGKALLISSDIIDCQSWGESMQMKWDECSLRDWLNDEFYTRAFTEDEKKLIEECNTDNVFILSEDEVVRYMPDTTERNPVGTDYAKQQGFGYYATDKKEKFSDGKEYTYLEGFWWIRTEADGEGTAAYVDHFGNTGHSFFGNENAEVKNVTYKTSTIGVRPVIWIADSSLEMTNNKNEKLDENLFGVWTLSEEDAYNYDYNDTLDLMQYEFDADGNYWERVINLNGEVLYEGQGKYSADGTIRLLTEFVYNSSGEKIGEREGNRTMGYNFSDDGKMLTIRDMTYYKEN